MASGTVNALLMVHEVVIDIGFPMQEAVTNHPTHEAEGTRSHFNAVFSLTTFTSFTKPKKVRYVTPRKKRGYSLGRLFLACILLKPLLELLDGLPSETGQARVQHQLEVRHVLRGKNRPKVTWTKYMRELLYGRTAR